MLVSPPANDLCDLKMHLRGVPYRLPGLIVAGERIKNIEAYWAAMSQPLVVSIFGNVDNILMVSKHLPAIEIVRLILREHQVPWSLPVRAKKLITFTKVPDVEAERPLPNEAHLHFRAGEAGGARCPVEMGPVPHGVERLVLHIEYDERSPAMPVAQYGALPIPRSLKHLTLIYSRSERHAGGNGAGNVSAVFGRLRRRLTGGAVGSMAAATTALVGKCLQADGLGVTLVGLEVLVDASIDTTRRALLACLETDRDEIEAAAATQAARQELARQRRAEIAANKGRLPDAAPHCPPPARWISPVEIAARVRVLTHADYAALVGPEVYALETVV
jgi:hypothetical protein